MEELKGYKAPCHTTIKRWAEKVGYLKLHAPLPKAEKWTIIVDASIQMGDQKCLIFLGCPSDKIPIGRPLKLEDLHVLSVEILSNLNGNKMAECLIKTKEKCIRIDSICSDRGSDVLCGIKEFMKTSPDSKHISDTAHRVANFIEKRVKNDPLWTNFKKQVTQARRAMQNSTIAGAMPPGMRAKARFMNVDKLVYWAADMLLALDNPKGILDDAKEFNKHLGCLKNYREDIALWEMFISLSDKAKGLVREGGMHQNIVDSFIDEISEMNLNEEAYKFAEDIIVFFQFTADGLDPNTIYVGSSEIIESLFSKVKFMEGDQTSFGFTSLVLAAVAHVGPMDADLVAKAIETVKVDDIKAWSEEQVGVSVQSFRKRLRQNIRRLKKKLATKLTGVSEDDIVGF